MSDDIIHELAQTFHLLGDASRLRIMLVCLDRPVAVGDIAAAVGLTSSLVSHHLRLLKAARLVSGTRRGKHVFYVAADDHVRRMLSNMLAHQDEPRTSVV